MRWRERIRGERGEITPHASRGTHEFDQAYGFELEDYPAFAKAADAWAKRSKTRRQGWRFILRSKK
jgi:hypothetical protein